MRKGQGKNSLMVQNSQIKDAFKKVSPPNYVEFETAEHWEIWETFVSRRLPQDWHDAELFLLVKLVHNEFNLRRYYKTLNKEGPVIENKRGTPVENPILRSIDTMMRISGAIQARLGLMQNFDVRGINERGKQGHKVVETAKVSLLAKPE